MLLYAFVTEGIFTFFSPPERAHLCIKPDTTGETLVLTR